MFASLTHTNINFSGINLYDKKCHCVVSLHAKSWFDYSIITHSVAFQNNLQINKITARGYVITLARAPHSACHQVEIEA